jgi:LPS O-antigen subunit length determinant protein (WzzB/FepE family)
MSPQEMNASMSLIADKNDRQGYTNKEEIDLLLLVDTLLKAKKCLFYFAIIFAILGAIASFLFPQKWTSHAIISLAEPTQLHPLQQALLPLEVLGVDTPINSAYLFNLYIEKFLSGDVQNAFIHVSPVALAALPQNTPEASRRAIKSLTEGIKAVNLQTDKKFSAVPFTDWELSFTGRTAEQAQRFLASYTQFIVQNVSRQVMGNLRNALALEIQRQTAVIALKRQSLIALRQTKIRRLEYALQIATAAGISHPAYSTGQLIKDDPDFPVMLGAKGLSQKLQIEKALGDIEELNADLRNQEYRLSMLKQIALQQRTFPVVNFQQVATLPLKKDGSGPLVIILLFSLIGVFFGALWVLFQHARLTRLSS